MMLLTTLLKEYGLNPKKTKLVRHAYSNVKVRTCCGKGLLEAYQAIQPRSVFHKYTHVMVFLGEEKGTTADFFGLYEIKEELCGGPFITKMPEGYPYPEEYANDRYWYDLSRDKVVSDQLEGLTIEWGSAARAWHQVATNEKEVLEIRRRP